MSRSYGKNWPGTIGCQCFMLLVSLVLVNVVIAVLLDAFGMAAAHEPAHFKNDDEFIDDGEPIKKRCPFERMASNISKDVDVTDLMQFEMMVDNLWAKVVLKGQINQIAFTEHDLTMKEFELLKISMRTWRFGSMQSWTIKSGEFQQGIKKLDDYIPPL
eukprot:CAMPEP_0179486982 /NCGR_PEP_ID=MMETSP0799-20121207/63126_1 /TAXON_ID=46947 /ORGANISM="Geminigera cryophila, Strain CCMP2564" /LENGTH=158 /DNA_ID=CAMNT_0021301965 /DNA_START=82 /DNA_END=555 /DNA_ORIENTATION=+